MMFKTNNFVVKKMSQICKRIGKDKMKIHISELATKWIFLNFVGCHFGRISHCFKVFPVSIANSWKFYTPIVFKSESNKESSSLIITTFQNIGLKTMTCRTQLKWKFKIWYLGILDQHRNLMNLDYPIDQTSPQSGSRTIHCTQPFWGHKNF